MPCVAPCRRSSHHRRALSLIEVMIAMAVLAVALSAAMSALASSVQSNAFAEDREKANDLARLLVERLQSLAWEDLMGGSGPVDTWTAERFAFNAAGAIDETGLSETDLISEGVLERPSGLADTEIHIEYYRALATRQEAAGVNADDGLLERWDGVLGGYSPIYTNNGPDFGNHATLSNCRISGTTDGMGTATEPVPIIIRVLIRWNLDGTAPGRRDGRESLYFIRKTEPGRIDGRGRLDLVFP